MVRQPLFPHVPRSNVKRLPQTSPEGKETMFPGLTREKVTETIIENLIQAEVLLRREADRYRRILATYDNSTLLKVLIHCYELKEARYA